MPPKSDPDRGLTRRWKPRADTPAAGHLLDRLLAARGLTEPEQTHAFLRPSLLGLHDPGLLPGIDAAARRLLDAAAAREPIIVYGDYDVDGVTATAILVRTLRALEPRAVVGTYVPHRLDEGYGLNTAAIEQLAADGARVIVSVDCGITAFEPAAAAGRLGVDLILTDHHNPPGPGEPLPEAFAVVHPRAPGSGYPFGDLCGAGVAFKLAWRLATTHAGSDRVDPGMRRTLLDLLPLAAIGTVADVVPLLDENRVIARFGLIGCRDSAITGLRALVAASGLDGERIDAERVGFILGPRLNACGRLGHAREAVELFLTEDPDRAAQIAAGLARLNEQRQRTERGIRDEAVALAEAAGMTADDRRAIVLASEDWHPGVVGIVCSRLTERFGRPAILMQRRDDGACAGSGRSVDGFNLHGALAACADHLETFGGHDMAAGLRVRPGALDAFTEAFVEHANARIDARDLVPAASYDCEASLEELTPRAVAALRELGPHGRGNPAPRLVVRGARLLGGPEIFGRAGTHLSLRLAADNEARGLRAVAWGWAEHAPRVLPGATVDVLLEPEITQWAGRERVEPRIVDLRLHDDPTPEVILRAPSHTPSRAPAHAGVRR